MLAFSCFLTDISTIPPSCIQYSNGILFTYIMAHFCREVNPHQCCHDRDRTLRLFRCNTRPQQIMYPFRLPLSMPVIHSLKNDQPRDVIARFYEKNTGPWKIGMPGPASIMAYRQGGFEQCGRHLGGSLPQIYHYYKVRI